MNLKKFFIPLFIFLFTISFIGCGEDEALPERPEGFNVKSEVGAIELTWNTAKNSDFYRIYRRTESESEFKLIGETKDGSITYQDSKELKPGETYYYKVAGVRRGEELQEGPLSEPRSVTYYTTELALTPNPLDFGESDLQLPLIIKNNGGQKMEWSISANEDWLKFEETSGEIDGGKETLVYVTAEREDKQEGDYDATITVKDTAKGESKEITAKMSVRKPVIDVSPKSIDFGESRAAKTVTVKNAGAGTLNWKVEKINKEEWLNMSPLSGKVKAGEEQNVTLEIVPEKLEGLEGEQTETIKFTNDDVPGDEKTVAITIKMIDKPRVDATPTEITFKSLEDTPKITVQNKGTGTLSWRATKDRNVKWLNFTPMNGKLAKGKSQSVTLELNTNLIQNLLEEDQTETIVFTNEDDEKDQATVSVKIGEHPRLNLSKKKLDFGTVKTEEEVRISNLGTGTLKWEIITGGEEWLTVTPTSGNTKIDLDKVTFIVDRTVAKEGKYSTTVTVKAEEGGEENITVQMEVGQGELHVSTTSLPFGNSEKPQIFTVKNVGKGPLEWKAATNKPSWIRVSPAGGKLDVDKLQIVTVTVIPTELNAGTHSGNISITSNGGGADVNVNLTKMGLLDVVVRDDISERAIRNAEVEFGGDTKDTNFSGKCEFAYNSEGEYSTSAKAEGYIPAEKSVTTNRGYAKVEFFLKPIPQKAATLRPLKDAFDVPKRVAFSANGDWAYVTNDDGDSVSIINTNGPNVDVVVELKCDEFGCAPKGIAASPTRPEVYVASEGSDQISIINTDRKEDVDQIEVGNAPTDLVVSPDGGMLYVVNSLGDSISVINLGARKVVDEISVGAEPVAIAISTDGQELYVANQGESSVSIVDATIQQQVDRISVTKKPSSIAVSPEDGQFIYVASEVSSEVSAIDRDSHSVYSLSLDAAASGIAVRRYREGEVVFVACTDGLVTLIDMTTKKVVEERINVAAGGALEDIAYNPKLGQFYLPDSINGSVEVLGF